jgi:hypothetical protein
MQKVNSNTVLIKSRHQTLELNESKPHSHTSSRSVLALLHPGFAYYGIWTKVRPGRSGVRIPTGSRHSSLLQNVQNGSGVHTAPCTMGTGVLSQKKSDRGVKLTSHLLLVLRLGMSEAIHFILYVFIVQGGTSILLRGSSSLHRQAQLRSQEKWKVACNE